MTIQKKGEIYNYIGGISLENNRELRAINEKLDALIDILTKTNSDVVSTVPVREVYEMDNESVPGDPMEDNR